MMQNFGGDFSCQTELVSGQFVLQFLHIGISRCLFVTRNVRRLKNVQMIRVIFSQYPEGNPVA